MTKQTTVDQGVLQMALIGYELKRDRIEAAIAEIQVELGQGGTRHSTATATDSSELKATGKKRFSAAARKRMAAAQKKRWAELKAKKAEAAKPKHKPAAKRRKARKPASRKLRPVQVKAVKKTAGKAKATVKTAPTPKVRKMTIKKVATPKPNQENASVEPMKIATETPTTNVEAVVESPLVIVTE